jgi:hypothetical protein
MIIIFSLLNLFRHDLSLHGSPMPGETTDKIINAWLVDSKFHFVRFSATDLPGMRND